MKDEIKEILNRFEFVKKEPNKLSYYPEDLLTREEMWLLYDCITNLQEELEIMVKDDERSQETIIKLSKENERLYKELEKADSITQSCIFEGGRSAGKSYRQLLNWLEDYKLRNEKAIEYMQNNNLSNFDRDLYYILISGDDNAT